MSLLRSGVNLLRRIVPGTKHNSWNSALPVVACRNGSGGTPDGYDKYYLDEDDHVQPLDNTKVLTPEKRAQLAAKYNLLPEDYVPMNTPDFNIGDYPDLPCESALERDPYYDWDDKFHRRNYGEPILWHAEMYHPLALDTTPLPYDRSQMWTVWLGCLGGFLLLTYLGEKFKCFLPRAPKQFPEEWPSDGVKDMAWNGCYDFFEERGSNPKFRERKQVVNYTFEAHPWNPEHMA